MTTENIYQEMKSRISIIDYATRLGFTVVKKGRYYSLKEHDSVIIDPTKNCFWRNSRLGSGTSIGAGGSIIDFVMEFTGQSLHEVLKELSNEVQGYQSLGKINVVDKEHPIVSKLQLPEPDTHMHNVYAYLIKSRKIAPSVVQFLVDQKQLYQDKRKNCVFVSYDLDQPEKPVFACKRGTNTAKPFFGDVAGCDYKQCFYINQKASSVFVTESVIDALSIMTLHPEWKLNYLVLAGVGKIECLIHYLQPGIDEVIIGTDNDTWGQTAAIEMKHIIEKHSYSIKVDFCFAPKPYKDWNEYLQKQGG